MKKEKDKKRKTQFCFPDDGEITSELNFLGKDDLAQK